MRVLILGGTSFAGRAIAEDAIVVRVPPDTAPPLTRGFTPEQEAAVLAATGVP